METDHYIIIAYTAFTAITIDLLCKIVSVFEEIETTSKMGGKKTTKQKLYSCCMMNKKAKKKKISISEAM